MKKACPNCCELIGHEPNGCVLEGLLGVVEGRENLTREQVLELWRKIDVDGLWDAIGPVIDDLEAGKFSRPESRK